MNEQEMRQRANSAMAAIVRGLSRGLSVYTDQFCYEDRPDVLGIRIEGQDVKAVAWILTSVADLATQDPEHLERLFRLTGGLDIDRARYFRCVVPNGVNELMPGVDVPPLPTVPTSILP